MNQEEYTELASRIDAVATQDVHLGRVLFLMASHLPGYSDAAQAKADADAQARAEAEQERLQAEQEPPVEGQPAEATPEQPAEEPAPVEAPAEQPAPEAPAESAAS